MTSTMKKLQQNLMKAKSVYKKFADQKRKAGPMYKVGDIVWLSTKKIQFKKKYKFHPRFIGPFEIEKCINPVAFKLKLLKSMKIYPVFHTSLLKPAWKKQYVHHLLLLETKRNTKSKVSRIVNALKENCGI